MARDERGVNDLSDFITLVTQLKLQWFAVYTGYTIEIFWANQDMAKTAKKTFEFTQRPYIGILDTTGVFEGEIKGKIVRSLRPFKEAKSFSYLIDLKNFGPVPGNNFMSYQRVSLGGKEMPVIPGIEVPTTMFPSEILKMNGVIRNPQDLADISNGTKSFEIEVTVPYDGPSAHYTYCEKERFDPMVGAFDDMGPQPNCH